MKTREFPTTFLAILAALLLAFPAVGLAGETADQEYEPPTEEQQQEQQEQQEQERERQTERQTERQKTEREKQAREQRAQQRQRQTGAQARQMTTVTVSVPTVQAQELTSQPRQYFGELVQVSAQVEETHGNHLLTLQSGETGRQVGVRTDVAGQQQDKLVVVIPRQASADIPKNEDLQIVGHVRPLVWTEFERDFVWFNMDLFQQYQQELEQAGAVRTDQPEMDPQVRPVLIATSIKTQDGEELLKQEGTETSRQGRTGGTDR